jgi:hypothetical protein
VALPDNSRIAFAGEFFRRLFKAVMPRLAISTYHLHAAIFYMDILPPLIVPIQRFQ